MPEKPYLTIFGGCGKYTVTTQTMETADAMSYCITLQYNAKKESKKQAGGPG
jgi:hypothetical protein